MASVNVMDSSVTAVAIPSGHEVLFAALNKAGFDIEFRQGENSTDVIIRFCEYIGEKDPDNAVCVADILTSSGYSHFVLHLRSKQIKLHDPNVRVVGSVPFNVVQNRSCGKMASENQIDDVVDGRFLAPAVSLPLKHEIVFDDLANAGFPIEFQPDENPFAVIINFCDNIRVKDPDSRELIADIFRRNGHSHLVMYLYNEDVKLIENFDIADVCKYFPEIEINVIPALESELRLPSETVYRMTSTPRGLALVINNRKFEFGDTEIRYGSERDSKYWTSLFSGLGYEVYIAENLTAEQMRNAIKAFANQEQHDNADSCILAISTHGINQIWLQGIDGLGLEIDSDVLVPFNNVNCPKLKGKPKLFFIQACRGDERDQGTDEVDSKPITQRYPSWSDIAIIHSTVPGYVSNRSQCEGSWFVQAMVKVFMAHSHDKDLETMLKMVTVRVMQLQTYDCEMQAPEITYRGWTKSLYFNPGY